MKRKNSRNYRTTTSTEVDYMKVIKISVGVLLVLALVYFVTAIASGEIKFGKEKKEETETTIQYKEIIAGEIFNRNADEYYVLVVDFTDSFANYYSNLISSYNTKDNSLPFYIVDMEKKINNEYLTNELKVDNPTILKVKNGKTVEKIVGKDDIIKFFND